MDRDENRMLSRHDNERNICTKRILGSGEEGGGDECPILG